MKHSLRFCLLVLATICGIESAIAQWVHTSGPKVTVQCFGVINKNLFAGTNNGVYLTTNSGTTWTQVNAGLADTGVTALAVIGTNLFASTYSGVFLSTNNGASWNQVNSGLVDMIITKLAVVGTTLFAATSSSGVYASTNNGTSWAPANGTVFGSAGIQLLSGTSTTLFASSSFDNIIYRSTDKGDNWSRVDDGILSPERSQNFVSAFVVSGENLFISIEGAGIYRRPLNEMVTAVKPGPLLETGWALNQNYPNPFNPKTVVSGQWSVASVVRLAVYDILGREVAVLADGRYPAGKYTFTFDGSPFSSGTYFYRLTAGSYTAVRKMSLIK